MENADLAKKNESLESDRLNLLRELRENAARIGKDGAKFMGLSASHLKTVIDFVKNLRKGYSDLPLNDKSLKLNVSEYQLEKYYF